MSYGDDVTIQYIPKEFFCLNNKRYEYNNHLNHISSYATMDFYKLFNSEGLEINYEIESWSVNPVSDELEITFKNDPELFSGMVIKIPESFCGVPELDNSKWRIKEAKNNNLKYIFFRKPSVSQISTTSSENSPIPLTDEKRLYIAPFNLVDFSKINDYKMTFKFHNSNLILEVNYDEYAGYVKSTNIENDDEIKFKTENTIINPRTRNNIYESIGFTFIGNKYGFKQIGKFKSNNDYYIDINHFGYISNNKIMVDGYSSPSANLNNLYIRNNSDSVWGLYNNYDKYKIKLYDDSLSATKSYSPVILTTFYREKPRISNETLFISPSITFSENINFTFSIPGYTVPISIESKLLYSGFFYSDTEEKFYVSEKNFENTNFLIPLSDKYWKIDGMNDQEWD